MRLQTLEIKGFKSFADKTTIHFKDDVIGIVGPNGCGKSNVIDAIRWVLGEQKSKELRSDKMESVIFNGTKQRKQAGLAEVSLTFENTRNLLPTEYNIVTITRILYRTGESEYRLNGVSCRLKDITTLLLDTGIGSNSYAIIALGMVDDLLADREQSRRRLFEQAAGITKYKARKQETLTKLRGTDEDLNRVEDLLHEIDGQLKILERQAKRAKKWVEMKDEYRSLSLHLAVYRLQGFKHRFQHLKEQIQLQDTHLASVDAAIATAEARLAQEKQQNLEKEKLLSERQRSLNSLVGRIRGTENDRKLAQQKIEFLEHKKTDLQKQIHQADRQLAQLQEDIAYYRTELNAEKRVEASLETDLNNAENALKAIRESHATLRTDLDARLKEQQQLERTINELERRQIAQQTSRAQLLQDIKTATDDHERRAAELANVKEQRDKLHKKITQQQRFVEDMEEREEERKEQLATEERRLILLQNELNAANRQLDSKRNEYKLTKSLVESMEGFPESIRFLSKDKTWAKQVPLLSDVLYSQPEYRVAIENYLEAYLNFYLADSVPTATEAIARLSSAQRGRANFFILSEMAQTLPENPIDNPIPDTWKPALEVVQCDEAFRPLFAQLLQNVYIFPQEDKEKAANIAQDKLVLIANDGTLILGKNVVAGGSVGLFEGKRLGRRKNLELLEAEIPELEQAAKQITEKTKQIEAQIDQLKKQNHEPLLRRERETLNQLKQEIVGISAKLDNAELFMEDLMRRKAAAEARILDLETSEDDLKLSLDTQKNKLQTIVEAIQTSDGAYKGSTEKLSQASSQFNEKNIAFIRQQNKVEQLQRELAYRERQQNELKNNTERNQKQLKTDAEDLQAATQQLDTLTQSLQGFYQERTDFEKTLTDAEQLFYQSRNEINALEDKVREQNRSRQAEQNRLLSLKEQFNEVKMELTAISERLRVEFSVEVNDLLNQEPNPEFTQADLTERVDSLKKRLDTYGEVNPMAIEAYNEMAERQSFIIVQRDDLLSAKNDLLETIKEIETTATNRFMESFSQVREHFIRVFRSLFTEDDTCDLVLAEPDNPLESRIEITAKPKGKRPQTINQLSGGEKTLTATALLFSLYLLKPAPFCIFDEVDAPLDDANIDKFNKIIKEFSKNSQFIIVTHNKQTMAAVDVIYGVSMIEQGISRVLPVDFRSLN